MRCCWTDRFHIAAFIFVLFLIFLRGGRTKGLRDLSVGLLWYSQSVGMLARSER